MEVLIGARAIQGLGVGGLTALVQVVIASMVSPRERGRYSGYIGADVRARHGQRPAHRRPDRGHARSAGAGASSSACRSPRSRSWCCRRPCTCRSSSARCTSTTSAPPCSSPASRMLLVWVSLAGSQFDWVSATTALLVVAGPRGPRRRDLRRGAGRRRADHPAAPLPRPHHGAGHRRLGAGRRRDVRLDRLPEPVLPARPRHEPDQGRPDVDRDGRRPAGLEHRHRPDHHRDRVAGSATSSAAWSLVVVGLLPCSPRSTRPPTCAVVGAFMAVLGLGLGATMQNLVLAVQNNVAQSDMGAASSVVAFFRSMGGSIGVSALGAVLSHQVAAQRRRRPAPRSGSPTDSPRAATRSPTWRRCRRRCARSSSTPSARPPGTCSWSRCRSPCWRLVCVLFIKEVPLRTTILREDEVAPEVARAAGRR